MNKSVTLIKVNIFSINSKFLIEKNKMRNENILDAKNDVKKQKWCKNIRRCNTKKKKNNQNHLSCNFKSSRSAYKRDNN